MSKLPKINDLSAARTTVFSCGSRHPDDEVEVEGALAVHQVLYGCYSNVNIHRVFEKPGYFCQKLPKLTHRVNG